MTRYLYAGGAVIGLDGVPLVNASAQVYSLRTGGSVVSDILSAGGAPLAGTVTTDANGQVLFQGPDGMITALWLQFATGPRWPVVPANIDAVTREVLSAGGASMRSVTASNTATTSIPITVNALTGTTTHLQRWAINSQNVLHLGYTGELVSNIPADAANFIICNATGAFTGDYLDFKKDTVQLFAVGPGGQVVQRALDDTVIPLTLRRGTDTSPTADVMRVRNAAGDTTIARIDKDGVFHPGPNNGRGVTYTPTWTTASGSPSVGSTGTIAGMYYLDGKRCEVVIHVKTGGTGVAFGTGEFRFSLPFACRAATGGLANNPMYLGSAYGQRVGTSNQTGVCGVAAGASVMRAWSPGGITQWQSDVPVTWAAGDFFTFQLTYETA